MRGSGSAGRFVTFDSNDTNRDFDIFMCDR